MTIDGHKPTERDVAYESLQDSIDVNINEVIRILVEQDKLPPEGDITIEESELQELFYEAIFEIVESTSNDTLAYDNAKHPMDPAYEGKYIGDILEEYELQDFAHEEAHLLMEQFSEQTDSTQTFTSGDLEITLSES